MPATKASKPKKIIQKRVARRERFARMARIRYRKERNEHIAKVQDLNLPPKYESHNAVYENALGLMIAETDEGLDSELSMLNDKYISNSVTVQNDTNKLISVKLHKHDHKENELKDQVLDEWERRNDPYWIDWAKDFKSFRDNIRKFLDKYKDKFETDKLDEEAIKKQRDFAAKRDKLMAKKPCFEIRTRFNGQGATASEIIFNSGFVNGLNFEFEEFIQKILMEGIPRLRPSTTRGLKKHPAFYNNFEGVFNNGYEVAYPETAFLTKNSDHKKLEYNLIAGGYFVKNAAEMSFLFTINDSKALMDGDPINKPIYRLYMEQQMAQEAERKYFIEMFYKEEMAQLLIKPKEICQVRACVNSIEEESGVETDKDSTVSGKTSEELVLRDNIDFPNKIGNNESIVSVPFSNEYFSQVMPHMELMKTIFQKQQNILSQMFQQNVSKRE